LRFNYRSQMSQLTVTHPTNPLAGHRCSGEILDGADVFWGVSD
jgi:hypothetical protein